MSVSHSNPRNPYENTSKFTGSISGPVDGPSYTADKFKSAPPSSAPGSSSKAAMLAPRKKLWGSRSVECFDKIEQIGEGTYGKVYMAKNKETGEIVALKKVRMDNEKDGFPITTIREIKILKDLHHTNIVQLKEIVTGKEGKDTSIYLVFEYMDHDLTGIMINEGKRFIPTLPQIKCYMKQLLEGLNYCHINNVIHRDIKGSNILLNNKGELKLTDFGLARYMHDSSSNKFTNRVITLWYRPPELLLGSEQYAGAVDIWSAGCLLAEFLMHGKNALFPGKAEADQLEKIWNICGSPTAETWADAVTLPLYSLLVPKVAKPRILREQFKHYSEDVVDLLDKMLTLDPKKRITAMDALSSEFFDNRKVPPCALEDLPKFGISSHEYQAKKRRQHVQSDTSKKSKSDSYQAPPSQHATYQPHTESYNQGPSGYQKPSPNPNPYQQKPPSQGPPPSNPYSSEKSHPYASAPKPKSDYPPQQPSHPYASKPPSQPYSNPPPSQQPYKNPYQQNPNPNPYQQNPNPYHQNPNGQKPPYPQKK